VPNGSNNSNNKPTFLSSSSSSATFPACRIAICSFKVWLVLQPEHGTTPPPQQLVNKDQTVALRVLPLVHEKIKKRRMHYPQMKITEIKR